MNIIILDGQYMTSREEAYDYIEKVMRFPEYFGKNLDALADCLSELDSNNIIILINAGLMKEKMGGYATRMIKVFRAGAEEEGCYSFVLKK